VSNELVAQIQLWFSQAPIQLLLAVVLSLFYWYLRKGRIAAEMRKRRTSRQHISVAENPTQGPAQPQQPQPLPAHAGSSATGGDATKDSIEVVDADPLAEAAVYLEFGYVDHAALVLRQYVSGVGSSDRNVMRRLLLLYKQLGRIDDYAEVLELLCEVSETPDFVEAALLDGLHADIDNLHLRVIADTYLGLGPEKIGKLLGIEAVVVEDEHKAVTQVPNTAATAEGKPNVRDAFPDKAIRQVLPLIEGGIRLPDSFSNEEKAMLRVFSHPVHESHLLRAEGRMHSARGNPEAAIESLQRAIAVRPQALVSYVDLLWVLHRCGRIDDYSRLLWRFFYALHGAGRAVRERFLGMGLKLGSHPILESLLQITEWHQLEAIGVKHGLLTSGKDTKHKLHLVDSSWHATGIIDAPSSSDVMDEVHSYLEFGQLDEAVATLEAAILAAPNDVNLYPPLLDIYDRMDALDRLIKLSSNVKRLVQRPPDEIVPMLVGLHQRLQDRVRNGHRTAA
jgi:tetratricopeptide (TPR) repeat protein